MENQATRCDVFHRKHRSTAFRYLYKKRRRRCQVLGCNRISYYPFSTFVFRTPPCLYPLNLAAMASCLIFDPIKLLRVAPLLTSTSFLWFAHDEHVFFSALLHPKVQNKDDSIIPTYFRQLWNKNLGAILGLGLSTILTSAANLAVDGQQSGTVLNECSRKLYRGGLVFAAVHFCFVPLIMWPVQNMIEDNRPKGESSKDMERWLVIHRVRTLVADLPSWICLVGAVMSLL